MNLSLQTGGAQHLLMTRYNLPIDDSGRNRDSSWLARRLFLFNRYCLPSVRAQEDQNFTWALLVDRRTGEADLLALQRLLPHNAEIVLLDDSWDATPVDRVWEELGVDRSAPLLTSRLDSDDGIGRSYVRLMRMAASVPSGGLRQAFNMPLGLQWRSGRLYGLLDGDNPFMSLLEKGPNLRSVLSVSHRDMSRLAPIRQVLTAPQWVQVVHDSNLDNDVRGVRLSRRLLSRDFGFLAEQEPAEETVADSLRDVLGSTVNTARLMGKRVRRVWGE